MSVDKNMVEFYHNNKKMPDWIYYQLNGKSAEDNYIEQSKKYKEQILKQENAFEREIENMLGVTLEKALEDILSKLNY